MSIITTRTSCLARVVCHKDGVLPSGEVDYHCEFFDKGSAVSITGYNILCEDSDYETCRLSYWIIDRNKVPSPYDTNDWTDAPNTDTYLLQLTWFTGTILSCLGCFVVYRWHFPL